MNKRRLFANTIEYTNPPGKSENCMGKTMSSFTLSQRSRNQLVILARSAGIQPIHSYRALKQALSPICIQSNCTQTLRKKFYQTRSVFKEKGCAKAQLRKTDTEPFAIVAKTSHAKTKPIRTFDKRGTLHLQPQTTEEDVSRLDISSWRTCSTIA